MKAKRESIRPDDAAEDALSEYVPRQAVIEALRGALSSVEEHK